MGKLYERLWGGASCLALAMFGLVAQSNQALAQTVIFPDCFTSPTLDNCSEPLVFDPPNAPVSQTASFNTLNTIVTVVLPDGSGVGGSGPVQNQLNVLLVGPNAAVIQQALDGILEAPSLTFISHVLDETILGFGGFEDTIGPGTIIIGDRDNGGIAFEVLSGTVNFNTNVVINNFFTDTFQANNSLSAVGLSWLGGDLHTTFQTVLLDDGFGFTDLLLGRGRERAAAAAPVLLSYAKDDLAAPRGHGGDGWSVWTKGSFAHAAFEGSTGNYGFSSRSWNGAFGLDYAGGDFVFGAAAGLGRANVKQAVTGDFGELSTLKTGAYASWRPGLWTVTGAVSAGFSGIDATRLILLPTPAQSSYNARSFSAGLEAARRIDISPDSFIEPMAGLVYTHLNTGAFTETGGGGLGISGEAANVDALKLYLGARASTTIVTASDMKVTPELRARLSYDALNDPRGFIARMVADVSATPYAVTGLQPNRAGGMIGAGVTLDFSPTWQASASYDAEIRGSDVSHAVRGGLKVKF